MKHNLIKYGFKLKVQLWLITILTSFIALMSLTVFLPKILTPFYENNLYEYLESPLDFVGSNIDKSVISTEVAFIVVNDENQIMTSTNFRTIIKDIPYHEFLGYIKKDQGKFVYNNQTYYYRTSKMPDNFSVAITNDSYIKLMRSDLLKVIFPTMIIVITIITTLLLIWNQMLVRKVAIIKEKVDNINNDKYRHSQVFLIRDELQSLLDEVELTRIILNENEEYKNQMLQNISHDLKTPITVIKSHLEGIKDEMLTSTEALAVIEEEADKLSRKVTSLLQLNKLDYIKDKESYKNNKANLSFLLTDSLPKYKIQRPDVRFSLNLPKKDILFQGDEEMWQLVIDNFLSNFVRYAKKKITITVNDQRVRFYNDGPPIDKKLMENIFVPYEKGMKGQFGLGLAIISRTVELFDYEIEVNNLDKGVEFIIKNR